jgi:hypothetical protein
MGLCPGGERTPRHDAAQIRDEQGPLGYAVRAQGPGEDQVGLGRGPHARATGTQVKDVAIIQRSQGDGQACLLTHNRALCQQHSDLPALLCLGAWGLERPMCGIMEHARGCCK